MLDHAPLTAEWCHDSLPGLRDLATQVTNPDHPNLTLYYHHEQGLVCVYDHVHNITLPRDRWPQLCPTHSTPPIDDDAPSPRGDDASSPSLDGDASSPQLFPPQQPTPSNSDLALAVLDAAPPDVVALPSPTPAPTPPSPDLVPLPHPFRHLSTNDLTQFLIDHPDFRNTTLHCITLSSPFLLATTELNHATVLNSLLPQAHELREGSIWELTAPDSPTWITRSNRSLTVDVFQWIHDNTHDPWRGLQATTTRAIRRNPNHEAFLNLQQGQTVTILGQPFWCWHDSTMLYGSYVVPVSTYNHLTPLTDANTTPAPATTTNDGPLATLGVVPVHAFLYHT